MRSSLLLLIALALALVVFVSGAENRHGRLSAHPVLARPIPRVQWYSRTEVPQGWTKLHQAAQDETVQFTVVLKGNNADELERRFWAVSDPDSSEYGQFMTKDEIEKLVAPTHAEWIEVLTTLRAHGITNEQLVSHGDSFEVQCTVEEASSLFATTFYHYVHAATGGRTIRQWGDYSLPAALAAQTELVMDVHTFPTHEQRQQMRAIREAQSVRAAQAAAAAPRKSPAWIPREVSRLYGVPYPIKPLAYSEINAGVIEWDGEYFSENDLAEFSQKIREPVRNVSAYNIVGNNTERYPGVEASLDIQWIEGINPGSTPWFWEVESSRWMLTFAIEFLTATEYPTILSLSYGLPETIQCSYFGPDECNGLSYKQYIRAVDKQFQKIGLLGVSIIVCSQDRGVYLPMDGVGAPIATFLPEYPGTSVYVTSVGATEVNNPVYNVTNPPPACNSTLWECVSTGYEQAVSYNISFYLSGGGFSNTTARPAYQAAAVQSYLTSGVKLPPADVYNSSGRGFPDVSAIGYNGYVIIEGEANLVSGTSMSTPIVAAIIALVAHDFYQIAQQPLGFLNPVLYKAQAGGAGLFKDIVVGDNCESRECKVQQDGFSATKGWDPVTGLGSPVYPAMKAYFTKLAETVAARK